MVATAKVEERAHAFLSPSASSRWMNCSGSAHMEADEKETLSLPAEEGSVAHNVAEECLNRKVSPESFLGEMWASPEGVEFEVTQEMADAVQMCLDEVSSAEVELNAPVHVEERFDLGYTSGTADAAIIGEDGAKIIDLKYGMGVEVYPEENSQLKIYAIGAIRALGAQDLPPDFEVELTIVQPRIFKDQKVKSWTTTWGDLLFWEDFELIPAAEAAERGDGLKPGEWCHFCKSARAGNCPAIKGKARALAVLDETENSMLPSIEVAEMTPEQLAEVLGAKAAFKAWVKAAELRIGEIEDRAKAQLEGGFTVPGWKLVKGRAAKRTWKDEDKAVELAEKLGVEATVTTALTVARMEKAVKAEGEDFSEFKDLVEQAKPAPVLAPLSSKKPAISVNVSEAMFADEK